MNMIQLQASLALAKLALIAREKYYATFWLRVALSDANKCGATAQRGRILAALSHVRRM